MLCACAGAVLNLFHLSLVFGCSSRQSVVRGLHSNGIDNGIFVCPVSRPHPGSQFDTNFSLIHISNSQTTPKKVFPKS
jgi:hypothetical protein